MPLGLAPHFKEPLPDEEGVEVPPPAPEVVEGEMELVKEAFGLRVREGEVLVVKP